MQNYKQILKKKIISIVKILDLYIYINLCFSHKISYFFEISTVNVHISIKVFVSDKINLVKITTVTESSTFRTSYFSHQVVFQVMLCRCIFLTGNIIVCVAATQHSFQIRTAVSLGAQHPHSISLIQTYVCLYNQTQYI